MTTMTDDLISRQEALKTAEWVYRACEGNLSYYHDLLVAALMDLTPAKSEWVPCEERLPKDEEEVIVSVRDDSGDNTLNYSSFGWYACAGDFWVVDNEANERVVAWMPLPEPWKGEKE